MCGQWQPHRHRSWERSRVNDRLDRGQRRRAGDVRATAELLDAGGAVQFGRTTVLYVLATGADVLTGTTGVLDLRLRQLDADRAAGRVTADEYARLREQILGGGATETGN